MWVEVLNASDRSKVTGKVLAGRIMPSRRRDDICQIRIILQSDYFILFIIAVIYVIIISNLAISRHHAFYTNAWDLGIYSQALFSTLNHGKLLYYTAELPGNPSGSLFGIHFSPFLFLLVPFYAIYQSPVTLLILRPVAISFGLIPLYWILKEKQLNNRVLILLLAIVYLIYPSVLIPFLNFDVEAFLPVLFLFSTHYLMKGKLLHSYIFVVLALMVNEFVPLIIMSMAVYFSLLHREEIIDGLRQIKLTKNAIFSIILFMSGVLWLTLAGKVITHFNPTALSTKWEWGEFGTSPGEIAINMLANPIKVIKVLFNDGQGKIFYMVSLLGPLAFLSLLDPLTMIMTVPWLAASLLSINPQYYSIETQYPAFISAFIFVSAINGTKKLINIYGRRAMKNVIFSMFMVLIITILLLPEGGYFKELKTDEELRFAVKEIPTGASASVMPEVFPHLSNGLDVYPYFKSGVEYVLIDIYSWWYTTTLPRPAHNAPRWRDAEIGDEYGIVLNTNGVVLYKKGYGGPVIFEGVNFEYTSHDVMDANGEISQDDITIGSSRMRADVLLHEITDPTPLFFKIPQKVLPPGIYNVTVILKASSRVRGDVVTLEIVGELKNSEILTKRIDGSDFNQPGEWQAFNFIFTVKNPTFIEIAVYVTNSTDVHFYSMNIVQVSGSV